MEVCVELTSALGAAPYLPSQTQAKDHIMKQVGLAIALAAMVVAPAVAQDQAPAARLEVTPMTVQLESGEQLDLQATVYDLSLIHISEPTRPY